MHDPIVFLKIGPEKVPFGIHRSLLCNCSTYFKSAFTGSFKEATEQVIELEKEDVDIMEIFVRWLYFGRLCSIEDDEMDGDLEEMDLCRLWVFADMRGIPELMNIAINELHENLWDRGPYDHDILPYVLAHTGETADLRRFYVEAYAVSFDLSCFSPDRMDYYDKAFLIALLLRIGQLRDDPIERENCLNNWEKIDICRFHMHEGGTDCHRKKTAKSKDVQGHV